MQILSDPIKHLKSVNESYLKHGSSALIWGGFMILTGIILVVHGIFPFLFAFVPAQNINKIKRKLDERNEAALNRVQNL